jgi:hypothetical protein
MCVPNRISGTERARFTQPRATPWGKEAFQTVISAQRVNRFAANAWAVGPNDRHVSPGSPGRCPGLGEPRTFGPGLGRVFSCLVVLAMTLACGQALAQPPRAADNKTAPKVAPAVIGGATNAEAIPATLDQTLADAVERSPLIAAARARLALAQAELSAAQVEVAKKVVDLWGERQTQTQIAGLAREKFERFGRQAERGMVDRERYEEARKAMIDAEAKRAQIETELRYLVRQAGPAAVGSRGSDVSAKPLQVPEGPMVERIRGVLATPTEIDFTTTPLRDLVDYLVDHHSQKSGSRIVIQVDDVALSEVGMDSTTPITIKLGGISLGAAFQAIDDKYPSLKFVVRDYGILVTTPERAQQQGYMPVVDFWGFGAAAPRFRGAEAAARRQPVSDAARPKESSPEKPKPALKPVPARR